MTNEELLEIDLNNQEQIQKTKVSKKYKKLKHLIKDKINYYQGLFFKKTNEFQNISFALKHYRIYSKIIIKNEFDVILKEITFTFVLKDHFYGMDVFKCSLPEKNKLYSLYTKNRFPDIFYFPTSVDTKIYKILFSCLKKDAFLNNLKNKFYVEIEDIKQLNKKTRIYRKSFEYGDGYGCNVRQTNFVKTIYGGMDSKNLFIPFRYKDKDYFEKTNKENLRDKKFIKYKKSFYQNEEEI